MTSKIATTEIPPTFEGLIDTSSVEEEEEELADQTKASPQPSKENGTATVKEECDDNGVEGIISSPVTHETQKASASEENDVTAQKIIGGLQPADGDSNQQPIILEGPPTKTSQLEVVVEQIEPSNEEEVTLQNQASAVEQTPPNQNHSMTTKRRRSNATTATIEGDASTAFSYYRPILPLSSLPENTRLQKDRSDVPPNKLLLDDSTKKKTKRGKRGGKGKDRKKNDRKDGDNKAKDESEYVIPLKQSTVKNSTSAKKFANHKGIPSINNRRVVSDDEDPIHSILQTDDPILKHYLPQLMTVDNNYYSKVKPYRMGKRDLPLNQIEVILRRRAVKKRADVVAQKKERTRGEINTQMKHSPPPPQRAMSRQLPPPHNSPPRRKLFPTTQQQSPTPPNRKHNDHYEDDSTISSATVTSQLTPVAVPLQSLDSSQHSQQQLIIIQNHAMAISDLPKEETVGDTSLGLKLTILQGKVIIQNITPLDDGRASPAQLCGGLLSKGDIIIAVNGKSLLNGSVNKPVSMDKIISVLKPLSQPIDEETKEFSREVRLRFVIGEGKSLLYEQEEREKRKLEDRERRKSMTRDPAADLFGIGAFMAVDQHSGMPLFPSHTHHDDEEKKDEKKDSVDLVVVATKVPIDESETLLRQTKRKQSVARPQSLQAQIAQQVQLDLQWTRKQHTSEFFTLNGNAPLLLRQPSPPPLEALPTENPIEARKRRLERGAKTMTNATSLVTIVESEDNGNAAFEDEDPMEVASRVCGTASVRTGASRRRWHRGDGVIAEDAQSLSSTNPLDASSARSGESGIEECDQRLLIELAANNDSWKMNVMKRLEASAAETEREKLGLSRGNSGSSAADKVESPQSQTPTTLDSLLFGGDVANIMGKKKQSLALPPGEMTSMLFDLVELLETGLPDQIFMDNEMMSSTKTVSFAKNNQDRNVEVQKANDFLLSQALEVWLKSFRPLPWKQRRALWPSHSSSSEGDSMIDSRMDDNESLSIMSGTTAQTRSMEKEKRNLRELIEDLELDNETRRET